MVSKLILGAAVGDCVHVAGLLNFMSLAEQSGWKTEFLGPAVAVSDLIGAALETDADMIAVSYRLTPEAAKKTLTELKHSAIEAGIDDRRFVFGGTEPVCRVAGDVDLFERVFDGHALVDDVISFLKGDAHQGAERSYARDLRGRVEDAGVHPVIRHHFGLPTMEDTVRGIEQIADAKVVDIISIGPDQNTQSCFFRPQEMNPAQDGAGGVPVRSVSDFEALARAAERGNHPLLRCYSGTRDLIKMAAVLSETINNAWCAVPLCWYNVLDGRGKRSVAESIAENVQVMKWHADRNIPVEVNEAHHWSLRDAHDTVAVVCAYLAAYNAKRAGVKEYVAQFMFNTPPGLWIDADLGKMLAKIDLLDTLAGPDFRIYRQTRAGLASYPADMEVARGQLATSVFVQMALKPDIVHVVSFSEADHAATPDDVVESVKIARGVIRNCLQGMPDLRLDERVQSRRRQLVSEAGVLLEAIKASAGDVDDPLAQPETIASAIKNGLLDAPHLKGNRHAYGKLNTRIINGQAMAIDDEGNVISEKDRLEMLKT